MGGGQHRVRSLVRKGINRKKSGLRGSVTEKNLFVMEERFPELGEMWQIRNQII